MGQIYTERKQTRRTEQPEQKENASFARVTAAAAAAAQSGAAPSARRIDLPRAMRAKMEDAFHADFSALRLYESQRVADAGAKAVTQGPRIAFAPGVLDLSGRSGQALLGHELSHVVSQSRGEARGSGFLHSPALEARADREGAMAAAGQRIAAPTAALTDASAAPAAGPMQAKKYKDQELDVYASMFRNRQPDPDAADDAEGEQAGPVPGGGASPPPESPELDGGELAPDVRDDDAPEEAAPAGAPPQQGQNVDLMNLLTPASHTATLLSKGGKLTESLTGTESTEAAELFNPISGMLSGIGGVYSGAIGAMTGLFDTVRNAKNVSAGASAMDAVTSGADTLSSLGKTASGALNIFHAVGETVGPALPGLSVATGGISFLTGGVKGIRGQSALNTMKRQLGELDGREDESPGNKRLAQILRQGKSVSERNRTSGALKSLTGALGLTTGALALSGAGGLGSLFTGIGAGITGLTNFIYDKVKNHKIRNQVIADELGINWDTDTKAVHSWAKGRGMKLSDKEARAILLKSRGFSSGTRHGAYKEITQRRANDLYDMAFDDNNEGQQGMAREAIAALGVKLNGNADPDKVKKLLAKKLT